MLHGNIVPGRAQPPCSFFGAIHRAMLSACAAERSVQIVESPPLVRFGGTHDQGDAMFEKLAGRAFIRKEGADIVLQPIAIPKTVFPPGIAESATIEHEAAVTRRIVRNT